MNYNDITQRYFERAPHAGMLHGAGCFRGTAGEIERGLKVQFDLRVVDGMVREVKFLCFGCPHSIAVAAYLAECAPLAAPSRGLPLSVKALQALFEVPPEKLGRLLLIEDAWAQAAAAALANGPGGPHL